MSKRKRRKSTPLPIMGAELALASWEVIARRSWMMALGHCSDAEYRRMIREKVQAAHETGLALAMPWTAATGDAAVSPWHRRVTANARRLRKR